MKTWAQYIWYGHKDQWFLFFTLLLPIVASPLFHLLDSEHAATYFSKIALPFIIFGYTLISKGVINKFNANANLQLTPDMLSKTRHCLLTLNIGFIGTVLLLGQMHGYAHWNLLLFGWAIFTAGLTWHFLIPSILSTIVNELLLVSLFLLSIFFYELPNLTGTYLIIAIAIISSCYILILKGPRHSNTSTKLFTNETRQAIDSSPLFYSSPSLLFRLFGIFGLQQQLLTYWISIFVLLYGGIISCLYFAPEVVDVFLVFATLGATVVVSLMPLMSKKSQIKSLTPWSLMPLSNNRLHFAQRFIKDALLTHIKLLTPIYLILIFTQWHNQGFAIALSLLSPAVSLVCAGIAWVCIAKQWHELPTALTISTLIVVPSPWLASILSDQILLIAIVVPPICALAFWLYQLSYQSLALLDWD